MTTLLFATTAPAHQLRNSRPCEHCKRPIPLGGPVICLACRDAGHCTICGQEHPAWRCPDVTTVLRDLEATDVLKKQAKIDGILARYRAHPITDPAEDYARAAATAMRAEEKAK